MLIIIYNILLVTKVPRIIPIPHPVTLIALALGIQPASDARVRFGDALEAGPPPLEAGRTGLSDPSPGVRAVAAVTIDGALHTVLATRRRRNFPSPGTHHTVDYARRRLCCSHVRRGCRQLEHRRDGVVVGKCRGAAGMGASNHTGGPIITKGPGPWHQ